MHPMRLEMYVADHCSNCAEALRLAELARRVPGVEVRVINLDTTTEPVPARVVAVPTYLLDGRVVSLGNPSHADLLRLLGQRCGHLGDSGEGLEGRVQEVRVETSE
jgi:hypothetical protein